MRLGDRKVLPLAHAHTADNLPVRIMAFYSTVYDGVKDRCRRSCFSLQRSVGRALLLFILFGSLLAGVSIRATGQASWSGNVRGTVLEAESGKPVVEAEIVIEQLQLATTSNNQGRFLINAIALSENPQTVSVVVNAPGYGEWRIEDVLLLAEDTLILNVEIGSEPVLIQMPPPRAEPTGAYRQSELQIALDTLAAEMTDPPLPDTIIVRVFGPPYSPCDPNRTGYDTQVIDFKYYVKHVLPNEWYYAWPGESLRAGAMAAKMYGWFWVDYPGTWDVRDDVCDQVYNPTVEYDSTNAAVDFTWNWRMTRSGSLIMPHYTSDSDLCDAWGWTDCIGQWDTYWHALGNNGYAKLTWDEMLSLYYAPIEITAVETPPLTGYMLRFYGNGRGDEDRLKITIDPHVPADIGGDFTLEWWMKSDLPDNPTTACTSGAHEDYRQGNIIFDRDIEDPTYGDFGVSLAGGRIAVGISNGAEQYTLCGLQSVADGVWHHIAVTRESSNGNLRIFIDGSLDTETYGPTGDIQFPDDYSAAQTTDRVLVIGANKYSLTDADYFPAFNGFLDEIRLSNVVRYQPNFLSPTHPYETDVNTIALFHFDEGYGDTLYDTSSNPGGPSDAYRFYGGDPNGPEWFISDFRMMHEVYFPIIIR
jgi:hypothetical protein